MALPEEVRVPAIAVVILKYIERREKKGTEVFSLYKTQHSSTNCCAQSPTNDFLESSSPYPNSFKR